MARGYESAWQDLGRNDPFFGVLTAEEFRKERLTPEALAAFWLSGETHLERLHDLFKHHLDRELAPATAVDFGCGVGRVLLPLARRSTTAIGIDVAPGMLEEAQRACASRRLENVELRRFAESLAVVPGHYDFFHIFAVLQHVPRPQGMAIVRALLAGLSDGGLGALHVVYQLPRRSAWRRALRGARGGSALVRGVANLCEHKRWREPYMRMNAYDLNEVWAELQNHGCHRVFATFTDHGGARGVLLLLEKQTTVSL
jgi:SAM-dependent methyltransferase